MNYLYLPQTFSTFETAVIFFSERSEAEGRAESRELGWEKKSEQKNKAPRRLRRLRRPVLYWVEFFGIKKQLSIGKTC